MNDIRIGEEISSSIEILLVRLLLNPTVSAPRLSQRQLRRTQILLALGQVLERAPKWIRAAARFPRCNSSSMISRLVLWGRLQLLQVREPSILHR